MLFSSISYSIHTVIILIFYYSHSRSILITTYFTLLLNSIHFTSSYFSSHHPTSFLLISFLFSSSHFSSSHLSSLLIPLLIPSFLPFFFHYSCLFFYQGIVGVGTTGPGVGLLSAVTSAVVVHKVSSEEGIYGMYVRVRT